jgi:hypothetical protein
VQRDESESPPHPKPVCNVLPPSRAALASVLGVVEPSPDHISPSPLLSSPLLSSPAGFYSPLLSSPAGVFLSPLLSSPAGGPGVARKVVLARRKDGAQPRALGQPDPVLRAQRIRRWPSLV